MAEAITDRTKVVIVCTPNNPTGLAVGRAELEAFLDRVPPHVVVVVDEAYREFVRIDDLVDAVALYRDRPNLVVMRTFAKAYGLAGFRGRQRSRPSRSRPRCAPAAALGSPRWPRRPRWRR